MRKTALFTIFSYLAITSGVYAWENADIGTVGASGSVLVDGDTYQITSNGSDIWGNADEFHYMYMPLFADGQIEARVMSVENTNSWAKAGVMIRERLDATSAHAMMIVTPGNGVAFQFRNSTAGPSAGSTLPGINAPRWVRIVRQQNTITGFESVDGSNWNEVGSAYIPMAEEVYIGLCVTSHNDGVLCTAEFDFVSTQGVGEPWHASNPYPPDGARKIEPDGVALTWQPGEAPPEPVSRYDVYFSNDRSQIGRQSALRRSIPAGDQLQCAVGPLAASTTYYWRVDSVIDSENSGIGRIWSFTTAVKPVDYCPQADIDGDCAVTLKDVLLLSQQWLDSPACEAGLADCADVTNSNSVDLEDYEVILSQWKERTGPVVINEIHIDPDIKTQLVEFIELHNVSDEPVDISGWYFSRGVDFTFSPGTVIPGKGFAVVAQNAEEFEAKFGMPPTGQFTGKLDNDGETLFLRNGAGYKVDEVDYQLGFPWPTTGDPPGNSIQLVNPALDNELGGAFRSALPTPFELNTVLAENSPPLMRQVKHSPKQPAGGEPVIITAKVTDPDGVESVLLSYRIVEPGAYIPLTHRLYNDGWFEIAMNDEGLDGDAEAGDDIYTAVVPSFVQSHRRLIRYRVTATDSTGLSITGPYEDDPVPNFAYFVYNGVPSWTGAARPGVTPAVEYSSEVLQRVPVYHLLSRKSDVTACTWVEQYRGSQYKWYGTLVYDGEVYDHIRYRARGGVWRYAMGKNMWKFDFNRGHYFEARDNYGDKYDTRWDKLNFSACIQQGNFGQRGEQGMFEALTFGIFNLVDVPAPKTHWVHFRIIDENSEFGSSQFVGDFWGLYMVIEQMDGKFLDEHNLPDGNLYKMEARYGELNNQGPTAATDGSDIQAFKDTYETNPGTEWWGDNVNLDNYYSHMAVQRACHHGDVTHKNHFFYLNPELTINEYGQNHLWWLLPWDVDLTWTTYYGSMSDPFTRSGILSNTPINIDAKNRVREFCDLLFNADQMNQLIDEYARVINDPAGGLSIVDADRAMWDYNPIMVTSYVNSSKAGQGRFYEEAAERGYSRDFEGMVEVMKGFVLERQSYMAALASDTAIPYKPVITETCPPEFPVNALTFETSDFSDPQGDHTFAGLKWRIAEVAPGSTFTSSGQGKTLVAQNSSWRYFKGVREPSGVQGRWRHPDFDDSSWETGTTVIGYGESFINTNLSDMRGSYSTVYYRKEFNVDDLSELGELSLEAIYDDGINIWINGAFAGSGNTPSPEMPYNSTVNNRSENHNFSTVTHLDSSEYLTSGRNFIAAQVINQSLSSSSDCTFDIRLTAAPADPCDPGQGEPQAPTGRGRYEIQTVWESDSITDFQSTIAVPARFVRPDRTYRVRCRMADNTGRWSHWSDPVQFEAGEPIAATILQDIRISELMYAPPKAPADDNTDRDEFEFIELTNIGDEVLDISGLAFTDGVDFDFGNSAVQSLAPGGFVLVVANQPAFESRYGLGLSQFIAGTYDGKLSNGGESIKLVDFWNGTIADFEYNDSRGWPLPADGAGHSLVPLDSALLSQSQDVLDYPGNWRASTYIGGSPGSADPDLSASIVINELMAHTDYSDPANPDYDSNDWIELYNKTSSAIPLSDWYLSDDIDELGKWPIPVVSVPATGLITFDELTGFHNPITSGFGLDKAGESLLLSYLPGDDRDAVVDAVSYKGQENYTSLGRFPDGADYFHALAPSLNSTNTAPLPHIVISEIMYHPSDPNAEYIELFNPTAQPVVLRNTDGSWRLDGGVEYTFTPTEKIDPGATLLVVEFDPAADVRALDAFEQAYSTDGLIPGVDITGPYSGNLSNGGERVALERPQVPDAPDDDVSWFIVDEVIYGDAAPWPRQADGSGHALHRVSADPADSGNNPENWVALSASPGQ